ncbi:aminomethyltransferase family protein [Candidatus Leptofilum sp.]|uniref:aminomethyltransferase family protein n=1 Tax=Candidatus Leptofilum sp. TaxID=3241576 RepID=UPI003B5B709F
MVKTTPFYPRLAPLSETMLWKHWAGYAAAQNYQFSTLTEYFAIRSGVAVFDTSPLFKYRIKGPDAECFLSGVLARDIRTCQPGQAQYTIWCDDAGYMLEDGVVLRLSEDEFLLTAAEPNLRYFANLIGHHRVEISDISKEYGILAVQGPHSRTVLAQLTETAVDLPYFHVTQTKIAQKPVILSRTGYTGDLGFEIWIKTEDALTVWDSLMAAGANYNIMPIGLWALKMARLEAGLLLLDVDFSSSRYAWIAEQRETPLELGFDWMFRKLADEERPFIGRQAIENEIKNKTSRWKTIGLMLDWQAYDQTYEDLGLIPPKETMPLEEAHSLYDAERNYLGYATSLMYSSLLKRHIAIGKLPPHLSKLGSEAYLELMVVHRPKYVLANVVRTPFYDPPHKRR